MENKTGLPYKPVFNKIMYNSYSKCRKLISEQDSAYLIKIFKNGEQVNVPSSKFDSRYFIDLNSLVSNESLVLDEDEK